MASVLASSLNPREDGVELDGRDQTCILGKGQRHWSSGIVDKEFMLLSTRF